MMKEALAYFPVKMWPLIGLAFFGLIFVVMLMWVYRQGADALYDRAGHLPLNDESQDD